MAYRKRFCVVCGSEETTNTKLNRGLCPNCLASEKTEVDVRTEPSVKFCRICGSLEDRGKWIPSTGRGLKEDLVAIVEADPKRFIGKEEGDVEEVAIARMPTSIGSNSMLIPVRVLVRSGDLQSPQFGKTFNAKFKLVPTMCPNCALIRQKYYEATLQIRTADTRMSAEEKAELLGTIEPLVEKAARKNKQAFIPKFEENPAGFDLYFGSRQVVYAIASKFRVERGATCKETFKAGKVDKSRGKRKDKVTILIKLPKIGSYGSDATG